jgi:hypothetical protein
MDLKQLQAMGAIVPRKLIDREVKFKRPVPADPSTWEDPEVPEFTDEIVEETVTVHLRKLSSADSIEVLRADDRERPFIGIHRGVCNADGTPLFESLEQAMQLQLWMAVPLFEAVQEVAGIAPKASARKTSSGAKSRSASAGAASKSGKRR